MVATTTQEYLEHELEMLQDENYLMKDDAIALREDMERWKGSRRNKSMRGLDALAKATIQFEDPLFSQEKEEVVCPKCGDLFKLEGYKVEKMEI